MLRQVQPCCTQETEDGCWRIGRQPGLHNKKQQQGLCNKTLLQERKIKSLKKANEQAKHNCLYIHMQTHTCTPHNHTQRHMHVFSMERNESL